MGRQNNTSLSDAEALKKGFEKYVINVQDAIKILNKNFPNAYITAIGHREFNVFDLGDKEYKNCILDKADIIWGASPSVEGYDTAKVKLEAVFQIVKATKPLVFLHCSDAHDFSDSQNNGANKIGNGKTWLKIEPTFEGLKQILIEPEDRICVIEGHPEKKEPYDIIESIGLNNDHFSTKKLKLSSGLNCIVGGKSTGKSLLATLITQNCSIEEYDAKIKVKPQYMPSLNKDILIHWKDAYITVQNSETRYITYFPQHYFNTVVDDPKSDEQSLQKLLKNVLQQTPAIKEAYELYNATAGDIDNEVKRIGDEWIGTFQLLAKCKQEIQQSPDINALKTNIDQLQLQISNIQISLSEPEKQAYQDHCNWVSDKRQEKNKIDGKISSISNVASYEDLPQPLVSLFEQLADETTLSSNIIKHYQEFLHTVKSELNSKKTELVKLSVTYQNNIDANILQFSNIRAKFDKQPMLKDLQVKLEVEEQKKTTLQSLLEKEKSLVTLRDEQFNNLLKTLERRTLAIDLLNDTVTSSIPDNIKDIQFSVSEIINQKSFKITLSDQLNKLKNSALRDFIDNEEVDACDKSNCIKLLKDLYVQLKQGQLLPKTVYDPKQTLIDLIRNLVQEKITVQFEDDLFERMSPGKRAVVLLRILIDLDNRTHPLIIDQPEDDLDNRSIFKDLVTYLKNKKKTRQIIVVTHNPNVVVGADSECVIVATRESSDTEFQYIQGALENIDIRQKVCEILDGGAEAFAKREKLYANKALR